MVEARIPSLRGRGEKAPSDTSQHKVEVRRSQRRHRTVTAYWNEDTLVVLIPARMTREEEKHWVAEMERRLLRSSGRKAPPKSSDAVLLARCALLGAKYLGGKALPASVRWVPPMRTRWASCTPVDATIRVSERLQRVPQWVLDYVLVHELAHLTEPGHDPAFWALVNRYPKTERAIGYLEGLSAAAGWGLSLDD